MKKGSKRALSRMLAGVMLVSSVFSTTFVGAADSDVVAYVNDAIDASTSAAGLVAPEAGSTHTADFAALDQGDSAKVNGVTFGDDTIKVVSPEDYAFFHGSGHGLALKNGDAIVVNVAGDATITLAPCQFGSGTTYTATDSQGNVIGEGTAKVTADGETISFDYKGDADVITITLAAEGQAFLHSVKVVNAGDDSTENKSGLSDAEAGKTYNVDFKTLTSDTALNPYTSDDGIFRYNNLGGGRYHGDSYGLAVKPGDTIEVAVAGNAELSLTLSKYAASNGEFTVTNSDGEQVGTFSAYVETDKTDNTFKYSGGATVLTLNYSGSKECYVGQITAVNEAAPVGEAENFELWFDDIATDVASGTDADTGATIYTKTIEPGTYSYKDSTVELIGEGETKFTPSISAAIDYDFGVRVANAYKAGARNANANAITAVPKQGDGTAIVFTPAATGTFNTYFYSTSFLRVWDFDATTGESYGYVDSDTGISSYAFKAEAGHTYVLSTTGKTNNCAFAGVEYIIDEPITVDVTSRTDDGKYNYSNVTVTLTDVALGTEVTIKPSTEKVDLAKGHTYSISTDDGGAKAQINGADTYKAEDDTTIAISFTEIPDVTLTGKITGVDDPSVVKSITFKSMSSGVEYPATIAEDGSYTVSVKPGDYNTIAEAEGYSTIDHARVEAGIENVNDVYFESTETDYILYDLPTEIENSDSVITFNNNSGKMKKNNSTSVAAQAGDTIVVPVDGHKKVTVSGWYSGTWDINGENSVTTSSSANAASPTTTSIYTKDGDTSVTINITNSSTTNYLYWVKIEDIPEFKSEINVPGDCDTLNEAATLISAMERPEGEAGRVTINLGADFQEQVVFDAPYITINGNGHEINWYYGTGYKYYSMDSKGLYNEALYQDKYATNETPAAMWGGTVIVRGDYFHAENVTFRNTFNYELTEHEKGDGLIPINMPDRFTTDVAAYAAKERSNALLVEANYLECKNCKILSSQDTLGRNSSATTLTYFKDCVIGGNVDYICGAGGMLFDNCELQWKTYSDGKNNNKIGYITAARQNSERPYIFRNCTITKDDDSVEVTGQYGRTWQDHSTVYFVGTETNGTIASDAWGQMSAGQYETASFNEYKNTANGEDFESNPDATYAGKQVTDEAVINSLVTDDIIANYLGGWTPTYYETKAAGSGIWGDADMSGVLTANDASATLARALDATLELSDQYNFTACDVNGDGNITAVDAACILQKVLDNDYKFPVEETPVLYVVGDSTACHYGPNEDKALYVKRTGYGDKLSDYLTDEISVENLALSGRSSLSFTKEANYQTLLNNVKEGDYVLIGFGHNDEKAGDDERYTAPGGTKETEGTFKNSLYTNYILPVQEAGATPILITPIVRRTSSGTWSDAQLHKANGGDYAQDMVDLASELGISVVNATELTKNLYDTLTPDGTSLLHAWNGMTVSSVDNTHLNSYGASYVSYLVADAVKNSDSTLKNYVKDDISAPADVTIEDLVNPDYVEPDGSDPADLTSQLWTTTSPFYASAFGDIGGRAKLAATDESGEFTLPITFTTTKVNGEDVQNFAVTENSDGSVNLRVGSADSSAASFGKIASSSDGLFMYYTPFDAAGNFEISGTVTVNGYFKNNQVAFGAIISDNMAIDAYEAKSYQYVAAGGFKLADVGASIKDADGNVTGTNSGVSTYARIDGSLNLGARNISEDIAPGTQLKVSIKKVGETFTATVGDVTETYTVPMSGDAYAGFFVSRNADITVSDIHYSTEVVE